MLNSVLLEFSIYDTSIYKASKKMNIWYYEGSGLLLQEGRLRLCDAYRSNTSRGIFTSKLMSGSSEGV